MAHDRCDATRWDKTQCSATECGAAESVCEVTHRGDADKLDTQDARGGMREKSMCYQCCQSVRMQISWQANIRRQMRECASSPCWVLAIISKQEEKGKASRSHRPSCNIVTQVFVWRPWTPKMGCNSACVNDDISGSFSLKAYLHCYLHRLVLQANVTFWISM